MRKKISSFEYMLRYSDKTLDKRGRPIKNIDFLNALKRGGGFDRLEATNFCNTIAKGIHTQVKADRFAKTFRDEFGIDCEGSELLGMKQVIVETKISVVG